MIPAHIIALNELSKLEKEKIWQTGNIKEYHSQLSEIIRRNSFYRSKNNSKTSLFRSR